MNTWLVVSDVHLGGFRSSENRRIQTDFFDVLDRFAADATCSLVLAGDLFDYWMEYPGGRIPPFGKPVLERIAASWDGRAHFVPGNHDCWEYGAFRSYGIAHNGEAFFPTGLPCPVEIFHGDGRAEGRMAFPLPRLNAVIRSPGFVARYQRFLPPAAGWLLMAGFSRLNRLREPFEWNKTDRILDVFRTKGAHGEARLFVCGHEHRHGLYTEGKSAYLNTGNFSTERTFAYLSASGADLLRWSPETRTPILISRFPFS